MSENYLKSITGDAGVTMADIGTGNLSYYINSVTGESSSNPNNISPETLDVDIYTLEDADSINKDELIQKIGETTKNIDASEAKIDELKSIRDDVLKSMLGKDGIKTSYVFLGENRALTPDEIYKNGVESIQISDYTDMVSGEQFKSYNDIVDEYKTQRDNYAKVFDPIFQEVLVEKYGDKFTDEDGTLLINNVTELNFYISMLEQYSKTEQVNLDNYNDLLALEKYNEIRENDSYKNFDINSYYNETSTNSIVDYRNWGKVNGLEGELNTNLSPVDFIKEVMNKEDADLFLVMTFVNGTVGENDGINCGVATLAKDGAHSDAYYLTNLMKADEYIPGLVDMYDYLYYTQGNDAANQYVVDTNELVNSTLAQVEVSKMLDGIYKNGAGSFSDQDGNVHKVEIKNGQLILDGVTMGLEQFFNGLLGWFNENETKSVFEYEQMYLAYALLSTEDKKALGLINPDGTSSSPYIDFTKDISQGGFSTVEYNVSSNIGNMIPSIALSYVNPVLGMVAMGMSAGGTSFREAITNQEGVTKALAYGLINGISEALLEYFLGSLPGLSKFSQSVTPGFVGLIKSMFSEFGEEFIQEGLDFMVRFVLFGEKASFEEIIDQMTIAGLYGMATGGLLNGVSMITNYGALKIDDLINNNYDSNGNQILTNSQLAELAASLNIDFSSDPAFLEALDQHSGDEYEVDQQDIIDMVETNNYTEDTAPTVDLKQVDEDTAPTENLKYHLPEYLTYDNYIDTVFDFNNRMSVDYGVDQGFLKRLSFFNSASKKQLSLYDPNIVNGYKVEYNRLLNLLISRGFSKRDAKMFLASVDSVYGLCSYAAIENAIYYEYINNPALFKKRFGFDMYTYINGEPVFNSGEALIDLYLFANDIYNEGFLFTTNENGKIIINQKDRHLFRQTLINTAYQTYLSDLINGLNIRLINEYLRSKAPDYQLSAKEKMFIDTSRISQQPFATTMDQIISHLDEGDMVQLDLFAGMKMTSLVSDQNSTTLGGGHSVMVTGVTTEGLIVSSWGGKFLIKFEDLQIGKFNVSAWRINDLTIDFKKDFDKQVQAYGYDATINQLKQFLIDENQTELIRLGWWDISNFTKYQLIKFINEEIKGVDNIYNYYGGGY